MTVEATMTDPSAELHIYRTRSLRRSQRWAWRLVAANGRTLADSGEGYSDRLEAADRGWAVVTGNYDVTSVLDC